MAQTAQYTAAEAAFVLREPLRAVKKALDAGPIRPRLLRRSGAAVRTISQPDLFYLFAVKELRDELTPKARTAFYEALQRTAMDRAHEVRFGRFSIAVADFVQEFESRTAELAALSDRVEFRGDAEPLIKGTEIEVHRIAALLVGGMSGEEILTDYPSLTRDMLDAAVAYASAHPKPGRPYPRLTAKRALQAAGFELLDEVLGDGHDAG